jgi:RNA polymerase sigma factor for flagellar operon FliA
MSLAAETPRVRPQSLPVEDERALWMALRAGEAPAREQLVKHYLSFAQVLAAKLYSGRHNDEVEFGEYMQLATVGLLEALDRYDPARGVKFKTFAGKRIIGSILNGLENVSEKQQQIAFRQRLAAERRASLRGEGPAPTRADEVFRYLAQVAVGLALGYMLDDSGMYQKPGASHNSSGYEAIEIAQLQSRVRALVERLPERERKVIQYHYIQYFQFDDIARLMDLSKGRISQLHKRALELLREAVREVRSCDVAW